METVTLKASPRIGGVKAKQLIRKHQVPSVMYGHGVKNAHLGINKTEFRKVLQKAGQSTLVDLMVEGSEPVKVLIHQIQYHPLTDEPIHVDFYKVNLTEKIKTEIPLKLVGEAPAVDELQGTLIQNKDALKVEALPQDLVHEIEVDISSLKTFEDRIHIKDLKIPEGIEVLDELEEVVALVQPPRSEEELAELEQKVEEDVEKVEVEEKGKIEEEGEQAPEGEKSEEKPAVESPRAGGSTQKPARPARLDSAKRAGGEEK